MKNRKHHFVAGMLGLALAGCAQTRSQVPKGAEKSTGPVGMTPVPSIHESINRGTGGQGMAQATLPASKTPWQRSMILICKYTRADRRAAPGT